MAGGLNKAVALFRATFAADRLEPAPEREPEPRAERRPWLRWLFAPEELTPASGAQSQAAEPARRGLFSLIFGFDSLPSEAPEAPQRRGRILSWLFGPENLD